MPGFARARMVLRSSCAKMRGHAPCVVADFRATLRLAPSYAFWVAEPPDLSFELIIVAKSRSVICRTGVLSRHGAAGNTPPPNAVKAEARTGRKGTPCRPGEIRETRGSPRRSSSPRRWRARFSRRAPGAEPTKAGGPVAIAVKDFDHCDSSGEARDQTREHRARTLEFASTSARRSRRRSPPTGSSRWSARRRPAPLGRWRRRRSSRRPGEPARGSCFMAACISGSCFMAACIR